MKTLVIFLCLASAGFLATAQDINEYAETDRIALNIPSSQSNSAAEIAAYINRNFDTENKKVRAVYVWVISHIQYSTDSIHRIILDEDRDQLVTFALRRRKGVCENFAAILDDICRKCGLRSFMVEGYTRQNGYADKSPHAWCMVFVDNKWSLYDPTWDVGQVASFSHQVNTNYFDVPPSVFIQTHMPFDPMFQLLDLPLTYNDFNNGNIKSKRNANYFNYGDSINVYEKADALSRYISTSLRIENNGSPNKMITTKLTQLRFEIEIIYQVRDSVLYNDAIADYNKATNIYNDFLTYRNNQFKPDKSDAEIQIMFDDIEKKITSARTRLKEVNQSKATLTLDTGDVEFALNNFSAHVKEQEAFLKNYQATAKGK